eukprot:GHVU01031415.1.p1 GENE.GHVU01031415.1~~GHVU01031415.1.p1  ORF type:complete len:139 (+),score=2.98 GHVU01031415.1:392-808(+)
MEVVPLYPYMSSSEGMQRPRLDADSLWGPTGRAFKLRSDLQGFVGKGPRLHAERRASDERSLNQTWKRLLRARMYGHEITHKPDCRANYRPRRLSTERRDKAEGPARYSATRVGRSRRTGIRSGSFAYQQPEQQGRDP